MIDPIGMKLVKRSAGAGEGEKSIFILFWGCGGMWMSSNSLAIVRLIRDICGDLNLESDLTDYKY